MHNDDTSKAAVNDADDFANFHQPVDVISVDPNQEESTLLVQRQPPTSAYSMPLTV
ncbi:hypothetical protein A2U01_0099193, partial [Trifolium medium]|nr:hypothetical protein [Trifolium medium]